MIRFVEMECPNCGGPLTRTGFSTAKCSHCGSKFLIDRDTKEPVEAGEGAGNKSKIVGVIALCAVFALIITFIYTRPEQHEESTDSFTFQSYDKDYSNFFHHFTDVVYGKEPEKVKDKELREIKYLHIFYENSSVAVEYRRGDGEVQKIYMPENADSYDRDDIGRFKGLEVLNLEKSELFASNLQGMNELTELRLCNSPDVIVEYLPHPEKLKTLESYSAKNIDGIEAFSNLENLSITCSSLLGKEMTEIKSIADLKKLKSLTIKNGDKITDFLPIQSLTSLEELYLDCEGLKDLSFLQNMTSMKKLSIVDSIVLDVSALGKLTGLKELRLEDNYEVNDYSALSQLAGLETLTLELGSSAAMPNVENWSNLTSLTLRGADSIDFLASLPQLRNLSIAASDCSGYMVFASLPNLESLKFSGVYGDVSDLNVLKSMANLKSLDISSMQLYGNVEYIFGIPNLQELNISDCSFGLDFDAMPSNNNLKILNMDRLELWKNIYVEYSGPFTNLSYDDVNLADEISFVSKFPNLEELYVQGNKLTDVAFTEHLPNLRKLDITGNYVTDLRPLGKLNNLDTVWCGENTISTGLDLGDKVNVVADSKVADKWW